MQHVLVIKDQTESIATLTVAILGVILGAASLGWQAFEFLLSGERVTAEIRFAFARGHAITTAPVDIPADHREILLQQGFTEELVVIVVRNRGRLAASVTSFDATFETGYSLGNLGDALNPSLPHKLDPGTSQNLYLRLAPLEAVAAIAGGERPRPLKVHGQVGLGSGKNVTTKKTVAIQPVAVPARPAN